MNTQRTKFLFLTLLCLGLGTALLVWGEVTLRFTDLWALATGQAPPDSLQFSVFWDIRFPKAITAWMAGAGMGVSGLLMQTYFRNPLAGPYELGIQAGASLGVAVSLLAIGSWAGEWGHVASAGLGAGAALFVMLWTAQRLSGTATLLILGVLLGYVVGAVVNVLVYFSPPEQVRLFSVWGMGSFSGVTRAQLGWVSGGVSIGLLMAYLFAKPLNALLLGGHYAQSLGVNWRKTQWGVMGATALMAGMITAYCGPVAFVGIAVPHVSRMFFRTGDHRVLVPASALVGAAMTMLATLGTQLPPQGMTVPLNAVLALLGAPVIIWVLVRRTILVS